ATDLMPEQIEEIRHLKNKVPTYMIVKDYYIRKERVYDIWNNCEQSQQSKKYELAEILSTDKKAKLHAPDSSPVHESARSSQPQDKQKKKALGSKSIRVSDDSSEIVGRDLEVKKNTIDISPESSPSQSLIISQDSGDVSEMFKKVNLKMKKVRTKGRTITSTFATGT
ncbi:6139_t:CDS:1, partial [Funneliformis geosporum]